MKIEGRIVLSNIRSELGTRRTVEIELPAGVCPTDVRKVFIDGVVMEVEHILEAVMPLAIVGKEAVETSAGWVQIKAVTTDHASQTGKRRHARKQK